MKKLLFAFAFVLCVGKARAEFNVHNFYYEFRSTQTCSAVANIVVATGSVFVSNISISSGSSSGSFLTLSNSSTTTPMVTRTTSTVYDVSSVSNNYSLNTTFKDGLNFTKTGSACVRINWEWYNVPKGKEGEGKHRP